MIRRKFRNADLSDGYNVQEVSEYVSHEEAENVDDIVLITSEVDEDMMIFTRDGEMKSTKQEKFHAPVLDLDFPAFLVPSSTPGNFHLYLDCVLSHEKYMKLLDALSEAGVIQSGYSDASKERGYTGVRAPWVQK